MATLAAVTAYFPDKILTPLSLGTVEPTYETIKVARDQLNSNAASVPSLRGGGNHGHLSLTLTETEFLALPNTSAFAAPVHPGPLVHVRNADGPQQVEAARIYKLNLEEFRVYNAVDQALRNQLLVAVNPTYLQAVKDPILGFGQITCLAIITHLRDVYGIITPEMLDTNKQQMSAQWQPPTPIETLFEQLRSGKAFAVEGGDSMSEQEQVRIGYNIIAATNLFHDACRDWRGLTQPAQQTFVEFQKHFKRWERDRRLTDTSASAGYHGANQVVQHPEPVFPAPPVDATHAAIAALQVQMAALTTAIAPRQPMTMSYAQPVQTQSFPGVDMESLAGSVITQTTLHPNAITNTYCWTHGTSSNPQHNSTTCEHPADGHKRNATMANQMGGSTRVWTAADRRTPR